ncbi:ABC transporter substrate-binding protein [Paralimibaculum aggregatum]|uniref:ABC transporter substrate-binding protein n=2 Tax=Paralimibaculum aggregatum TaxID=3036245 RepID=A0ABQ6LU75_9RHOB|nr:ABC transporter substrate-binding protein [Limibaculum sp. NKW23]
MRIGKAHGQTTDTLDPATYENGFTIALAHGVHGYLTEVASDGSLVPNVAESWEASADASTWIFKLRKGVTFHSGKALTAEDVAVSINYHRGDQSTSAAKPIVSAISEIRTEGDDTVVFVLDAGNADFPFVLSDYHLIIGPAKDGKLDWRSGDGCGAYKIDRFDPGVTAELSKNPDHWDAANRGWFEKIEMLALVDLNARTTALVSGDVDAIDRLDLKTVGLLKRRPGIAIQSVAGNQHYTFAMDCRKEPFSDVNVRLALKYGINRQELVDKILFGYGAMGNDHPIGPGQRFHNKDLPQRTYDPDKAKFHLKEAGLDGLNVRLSAADAAFGGAVDAAVLYQNSAADAGITIDVNRVPNDGYWSDVWMKHEFSAVYWGGRPVEDQMFSTAYQTGAAWNDSFWSNARFDELLLAARAELDEDKRRAMYYEMQEIVSNDGGVVVPMFASFVFALSDKIAHGDTFGTNWDLDGERWMERWWFA